MDADGRASTDGDADDLDDEDRAGLDAAKIDLAEAIETALKEADGTFDDAELEEENGAHHWKISVDVNGNDTDVLVDVTTGKAMPESDDDGDDDAADDN
ncbi:PepSY domain-containing protein [Janibacter anophelis]|uniref:PepSY domain-containing protein n=1 Tax=Janibacter anophelis TaxID=319054 RepID=UPI000B0D9F0C|nr:PepSY domain-containing protein [Janibacter anophelis]